MFTRSFVLLLSYIELSVYYEKTFVLLAGFGILNWQMMFMVLTLNLWPGQANSVLKSWNLLQTLTCNDFVWYEIWEIGKLHSVLRLFPTSIWLLFPKAQICDNQDQIGANVRPLISLNDRGLWVFKGMAVNNKKNYALIQKWWKSIQCAITHCRHDSRKTGWKIM